MATKEQKKKIYALGARCDMLNSSRGTDDELHLWVQQWYPDKQHISDLSDEQVDFIIKKLQEFSRGFKQAKAPDRMSEEQKTKAFRLTYRLAELSPSPVPVRDRLSIYVGADGLEAINYIIVDNDPPTLFEQINMELQNEDWVCTSNYETLTAWSKTDKNYIMHLYLSKETVQLSYYPT